MTTVVREEGWRRKPEVAYEGVETNGAVFAGIPTARWHLKGRYAQADLQRCLDATLCVQCWTPYPERPSPASARRILRQMRPFGRSDDQARVLIAQGCCGICGAEMSPEMARLFFDGYAPAHTRRSDPGERTTHGADLERLIRAELPV